LVPNYCVFNQETGNRQKPEETGQAPGNYIRAQNETRHKPAQKRPQPGQNPAQPGRPQKPVPTQTDFRIFHGICGESERIQGFPIGNWKLPAANWKLDVHWEWETGNWKFGAGGWKVETGITPQLGKVVPFTPQKPHNGLLFLGPCAGKALKNVRPCWALPPLPA
jgi:hypothetical protein